MKNKLFTLVYVLSEDKVLLGMKKRGFGAGRWNGFGGKLLETETFEQAALRELLEEACVTPKSLEQVGILEFEFVGNPQILESHVFKTRDIEGNPAETEEMRPGWFTLDQIPYKDMWDGDKYWLPLLLEGKKFKGHILFDQNDQVLSHSLEILK